MHFDLFAERFCVRSRCSKAAGSVLYTHTHRIPPTTLQRVHHAKAIPLEMHNISFLNDTLNCYYLNPDLLQTAKLLTCNTPVGNQHIHLLKRTELNERNLPDLAAVRQKHNLPGI